MLSKKRGGSQTSSVAVKIPKIGERSKKGEKTGDRKGHALPDDEDFRRAKIKMQSDDATRL